MNKVLIIRSNPVAPDPRVEKIGRALLRAGYIVSVIGWDRRGNYPNREKKDFGKINRLKIKANFGQGVKNIVPIIKWQIRLTIALLKSDFDIIHCCDFDTIIPGYIVSKLKRAKVVYDIFDFYADMLRNTPPILTKLIRWADLNFINYVDAVILADESRKEQISGTNPKILEFIYNSPEDVYKQKLAQEKDKKFRISYIGLLQIERGLLEMIDVVSMHPGWAMDIAGYGGDEDIIINKIKKHKNIKFHGIVDYNMSLQLSEEASVLFATYDPKIPNHKYSSPNKLFEAMMLGKPIIVSDNSTMANIVRKIQNGIAVPYRDKIALENALNVLEQDLELRSVMGKNSRKAYENIYGWQIMEEKLVALYRNLYD